MDDTHRVFERADLFWITTDGPMAPQQSTCDPHDGVGPAMVPAFATGEFCHMSHRF